MSEDIMDQDPPTRQYLLENLKKTIVTSIEDRTNINKDYLKLIAQNTNRVEKLEEENKNLQSRINSLSTNFLYFVEEEIYKYCFQTIILNTFQLNQIGGENMKDMVESIYSIFYDSSLDNSNSRSQKIDYITGIYSVYYDYISTLLNIIKGERFINFNIAMSDLINGNLIGIYIFNLILNNDILNVGRRDNIIFPDNPNFSLTDKNNSLTSQQNIVVLSFIFSPFNYYDIYNYCSYLNGVKRALDERENLSDENKNFLKVNLSSIIIGYLYVEIYIKKSFCSIDNINTFDNILNIYFYLISYNFLRDGKYRDLVTIVQNYNPNNSGHLQSLYSHITGANIKEEISKFYIIIDKCESGTLSLVNILYSTNSFPNAFNALAEFKNSGNSTYIITSFAFFLSLYLSFTDTDIDSMKNKKDIIDDLTTKFYFNKNYYINS